MTRCFLVASAALTLSLLPTPGTVERLSAQEPPVTTFRSSNRRRVGQCRRPRPKRTLCWESRAEGFHRSRSRTSPADSRLPRTGRGPVKLAMLFDISGSMRVGTKAVDARQAARHVFGALKPGDEAAVFSFDTRLDRVTPFTSDIPSLETALDNVQTPVRADVALRCHRRNVADRCYRGARQRTRSTAQCRCRADRWRGYPQPTDVGTSLHDCQQHRHPGLHRRGRFDDRRSPSSRERAPGDDRRAP